ncbi:hypothetical protein PR202_gb19619 [Eleusine coracana subsp. coracana]|uniref:Uncharacterized protein n=1 Tax=Eleusine coracana subsp. coracana TaxID=191504 RepID=A0AAV5F839_ELECO|nr:hypothetical protein QOZ80_3BG0282700 [Eleusine coracana subsp. coracana]GJN31247.1 hypothetical protein PR202_gb19619 [Eleusine coracana subsp. coracana]
MMSEKSDRRGRRQSRQLSARIVPALLFFLATCAFFYLFASPGLELPRIRIEYGRRRDSDDATSSGAPTIVVQPSPPTPLRPPPPAAVVVDGDEEEEKRLPPPRQLTDAPYSLGPAVSDYDARRANWLRDHPGFPAFVAPGRRPRVLMVTGSSPRRCGGSDGGGDHLLLRAFKNKADYCRVHGLDVFYSTAVLDAELSGFWTKLPLLRALMLAHPETELLWWVDSDAVFTDMAFEPPWKKYARHNLVLPGWDDRVYGTRSWLGINAGSFVIRNCQWSLDLLDAWARMGPRGPVRYAYGKVLAQALSDREAYEADDQSALVYLLVTQPDRWKEKTFLESSYDLHGFWVDIVDRYEEMRRNGKPGLGDHRWPLVTHFVGCKPCGGQYASYDAARCRQGMERALNFADDQILGMYGFQHESLNVTAVRRVRSDTGGPLDADDKELARLLHPRFKAAKSGRRKKNEM